MFGKKVDRKVREIKKQVGYATGTHERVVRKNVDTGRESKPRIQKKKPGR